MGLKELGKIDKAAKEQQVARLVRIKTLVLNGGGSVEIDGLGRVDLEAGAADQVVAVVEAIRAMELVGFRRFGATDYQLDQLKAAMALRRPPAATDPKAAAREALAAQGLLR